MPIYKRIVFILASFIVCVILLEGVLQIVGIYYKAYDTTPSTIGPSEKTILCIGDSFTLGIGAQKGYSYPDYLSSIFASKKNSEKYTVVNVGRGGQNSFEIIDALKKWLPLYKPKAVILLAGQNNYWMHKGYYDYKRGTSFTSRAYNVLYKLKTIKLFSILMARIQTVFPLKHHNKKSNEILGLQKHYLDDNADKSLRATYDNLSHKEALRAVDNLQNEFARKSDYHYLKGKIYQKIGNHILAKEQYVLAIQSNPEDDRSYNRLRWYYREHTTDIDESIMQIKQLLQYSPENSAMYRDLGFLYEQKKDYDSATQYYQAGIRVNPRNGNNFIGMGDVCMAKKEYDQALAWYYKGFNKNDLFVDGYWKISYLLSMYPRSNKALEYLKALSKKHDEFKDSYALAKMRKTMQDEVDAWLLHDLGVIHSLCEKHNTKLVLMTYPCNYHCNTIIKRFSKQHMITLVDNNQIFQSLLQKHKMNKHLFAPDEFHCSEKGYALIAENVYATLAPYLETNSWSDEQEEQI